MGTALTVEALPVPAEIVVVGVAFGLTSAFTARRIPTSTIQILVFALAGVALGAGDGVRWARIGLLAIVWVAAPPVAAGLGYALTKALDLIGPIREDRQADPGGGTDPPEGSRVSRHLGAGLLG